MPIKLTQQQFIEKARLVHGDKYDYSKVNYVNGKTKVCIICLIHTPFWQIPESHLNQKSNCPKCVGKERLTNDIVDKKLIEQSRTLKRVGNVKNNHDKIKWRCKVCDNIWLAKTNSILILGHGCSRCSRCERLTNDIVDKKLIEQSRTLKRVGEINGTHNKTNFLCLICNSVWASAPNSVLNRKSGCPKCKTSKGEIEIEKFLNNFKIKYKRQYTFSDCLNNKTGKRLKFDFAIFDSEDKFVWLIEFDGEQHYRRTVKMYNKIFTESQSYKNLEYQRHRDQIKNKYALKNKDNFGFTRISYKDFDRIEEILVNILSEIK